MSSDKIISTYSFYNRTKRADRNTINEAKRTKPTKSPTCNTVHNITCTVITVIQEQKDRTYMYTRIFMILYVIIANQIRNGSTYTL